MNSNVFKFRAMAERIFEEVSLALEFGTSASDVFVMHNVDMNAVLDAMDTNYDLSMIDAIYNYLKDRG